jgi:hypothetical protein
MLFSVRPPTVATFHNIITYEGGPAPQMEKALKSTYEFFLKREAFDEVV